METQRLEKLHRYKRSSILLENTTLHSSDNHRSYFISKSQSSLLTAFDFRFLICKMRAWTKNPLILDALYDSDRGFLLRITFHFKIYLTEF